MAHIRWNGQGYTMGISAKLRRAGSVLLIGLATTGGVFSGCRPAEYRERVDRKGYDIISNKQEEALGKTEPFDVEVPSNIVRRRLIEAQNLAYSGEAALGTDALTPIQHWPEPNYPYPIKTDVLDIPIEPNEPPMLTLIDTLRIGARNSYDYQRQKEQVFRSALDLELEQNEFRNIFFGQVRSLTSTDLSGEEPVTGTVNSGEFGVSRTLEQGATLSSALAVDLANLLTLGGGQSFGIAADATVSIPLLRGAGAYIFAEPLTQAERNVVYAIWDFERFKQDYAVDVASGYLSVLRQLDTLKNTEFDYRSRIVASRRARRMADAGRLQEIEVDQAVQNELSARQRWIVAQQQYEQRMDTFKIMLGLPTDAHIALDPNELASLTQPAQRMIDEIMAEVQAEKEAGVPAADADVELAEPSRVNAGPLELQPEAAIEVAFGNRPDLRVTQGEVYDAQRDVVVAADALRAELTLLGTAQAGSRRSSVGSATAEDAKLDFSEGFYSGLATLDLPLERTREAVLYRESYIVLEQAVRQVQILEDNIKLELRNELRTLLEARESLYIQAKAVYIAQKRVANVTLLQEAGRAEMRDLVDAQDALLSAQISLTGAVVDYRIAELEIQRDMGVLEVNAEGLWKEYSPETRSDA